MAGPAPWKLLTALWTVYLVWGSTYLAIKISVRTLPAFLSAGTRFLLAGALLALILTLIGRTIRVSRRELLSAALLGLSLLALGVGGVTLAETRIDSSTAAMIAGSVPLQVIVLRTLARERVALATRLSVLVGLVGLGLVVLPGGEGSSSAVGLALALGATVSWSLGSFFGHRLPLPRDGFVATTWEMLSAGAILLVLGAARGELGEVEPAAFSFESIAAWLYLAVFGSLIGFTAYAWLLRNAPISKVVTHQYVNPLVAIILGAALLDEQLTVATGLGAALIVGSVFVAVRKESARPAPAAAAPARPRTAGEAAPSVRGAPRPDAARWRGCTAP
jgi:drug/metabolite transporter (DMT)-like permease